MYHSTALVETPQSYMTLALPDIEVLHVPESSPTPTPVLVIRLNRPSKKNAFTGPMRSSIETVYRLVNVDSRVKVVVLTGAGSAFCAGADLEIGWPGSTNKGGQDTIKKSERDADHRDRGGRAVLAIHQCSKPTITAINGAAVGIGVTMCLPATIRIASADAKIGFVFSRRGIVMDACSSYFLPRLIGLSKALHVTATGGVYRADHPLMRSLFSEIHPTPEETFRRALELADELATYSSSVSLKLMRDLMNYGPNSAEETHLLDSRLLHQLFGTRDNKEGVDSFFEKRPPVFKGNMQEDAPETWPWWPQIDIGTLRPGSRYASKL
ncbi:hypothetical protein AYO21_08901 [Fonsecaea monophora]|uniref:Enoyl-CoA hydratase n=1 Tax=Fonsecaea monophora TaxID=254056 RepID=A0A177F0A8_9EURO|nr:hypothetical protein AYO21_08901 [Fonsecaea monophora]KAH0827730.1 enoyl-CoA hydratase/isomerase family protein [Fonsecaea pedrosoi]OAG36940.1 hypothetical protein AYO21_08901 [Fonsecaea monophora]